MSNQLKTIKVKEKINVNAIKQAIAKNDTAKQNELLDEAVQQISFTWRRTVYSILLVGKQIYDLRNADESFAENVTKKLISNGIFNHKTQISRLNTIGKNFDFFNKNMEKLPPAYHSLYYLSKGLDENKKKVETAINKGVINADSRLSEIERLLKDMKSKKKLPKTKQVTVLEADENLSIRVSLNTDAIERRSEVVMEIMDEMQSMFSRRRIQAKVEPVGAFRKKVNDFKKL